MGSIEVGNGMQYAGQVFGGQYFDAKTLGGLQTILSQYGVKETNGEFDFPEKPGSIARLAAVSLNGNDLVKAKYDPGDTYSLREILNTVSPDIGLALLNAYHRALRETVLSEEIEELDKAFGEVKSTYAMEQRKRLPKSFQVH